MWTTEDELVGAVKAAIARHGVVPEAVLVVSAEADNWRYRIEKDGRTFEIGFSRESGAWAREVSGGRDKHLISNDHPRIHSTTDALESMAGRVALAVHNAEFPPRDPPII